MKKIGLIFAALTFVVGIAVISCTKDNTQTDPAITTATDAILVDNSAAEITGIIDDYEGANSATFAAPSLKSTTVDGPVAVHAKRMDSCVTVTVTKTLTATTANVSFKIDFGTAGCAGKNGNIRKGTITSTYSWVKAGGWSRETTVDMYINDVHHVGTQSSTFGVTGPNNHAYYTEHSTMTVTLADGTSRVWTSERTRELMEGNGGVNPVKIYKITGNSSFTNVKGEKSTFTITEPLYTKTGCKGFIAGTVVTVSTAGVTTTVNYGTFTTIAAAVCVDGFTIKFPGDKNGKGAVSRFIKFGK